jgi:hypothetical protein
MYHNHSIITLLFEQVVDILNPKGTPQNATPHVPQTRRKETQETHSTLNLTLSCPCGYAKHKAYHTSRLHRPSIQIAFRTPSVLSTALLTNTNHTRPTISLASLPHQPLPRLNRHSPYNTPTGIVIIILRRLTITLPPRPLQALDATQKAPTTTSGAFLRPAFVCVRRCAPL